jgi:hypothetical protein
MARHATPDASTSLLKRQLEETFATASYPIRSPADLLTVLADGRGVFVVDDAELVALELALAAGESLSFPYDSPGGLVDDFVAPFREGRHGRPA